MPRGSDGYWICVEGGGSHTWMACIAGSRVHAREAASTSLHSVTAEESGDLLTALAGDVCRAAEGDPGLCRAVVAAHGAASTRASCRAFHDILTSAMARAGVRCPVLVTNDLVPLLLGGDNAQPLIVVAAGTGTGFGARSAAGKWARASGCEYLLSDEGGGFDIGLSGLRAAIRAADGRGPSTSLVPLAAQWCGGRAATLADDISETVYAAGHKTVIASFAKHVLDMSGRDQVAASILARAASELATGATAVALNAGCPVANTPVLLAGSLLTRHDALALALRAELATRSGSGTVSALPEGRLLDGFRHLHRAWTRGDHVVRQVAEAFPVTASGT